DIYKIREQTYSITINNLLLLLLHSRLYVVMKVINSAHVFPPDHQRFTVRVRNFHK
ncbi:hypothetical protein L9F63_010649, partial [Diploptera punctata]